MTEASIGHAIYRVLEEAPTAMASAAAAVATSSTMNSTLNLNTGDNAGKRLNFAYSADEQNLLRGLAIAGSTLSIISAGFMVFWFIQLRQKTFRHQLVMLLIISDFFKAVSEFVYPVVAQVHGNTTANAFCQLNGYFTAFFIDATDFAVLLIAVHTGLCIFFPGLGRRRGEEGLYRWRHTMYVLWFSYSVTLASLAFLNDGKAYTSSISWCYLPVRPFYWRIALSWGPRYLILLFILVLYISIYVYAKRKFNSFSAIFKAAAPAGSDTIDDPASQSGHNSPSRYRFGRARASSGAAKQLDVVSELKTHNLLDEPKVTTSAVDTKTRQSSGSSASPTTTSAGSAVTPINDEPTIVSSGRKGSVISITLPEESRRASVVSLSAYNKLNRPRGLSTCEEDARTLELESRRGSAFSHLDRHPHQRLSYTSGMTMETGITSTEVHRRIIVKQLNFVFIYPIVYLAMWIIPFCYHMTQYHDKFITSPIVALGALSAFIVPLHGFIDALVYARNEKPWRSLRFKKRKDVESGLESGEASGSRGSDASLHSPIKRARTGQTTQQAGADDVEQRRQAEIREAQARRSGATIIDPSLQPAVLASGNNNTNHHGSTTGEKRDWWAIEEERMQRDMDELDEIEPAVRPTVSAAPVVPPPVKKTASKKDDKELSFFDMLDQ